MNKADTPNNLENGNHILQHAIVVEDDPDISGLIKHHLTNAGYVVSIISDGLEAIKKASDLKDTDCDLVVLDLMLPGADGYSACKAFRKALGDNCGIIMLTAKNLSEDKILGFDVGADDYLTKPFCVDEFSARVKALQKRINRSKDLLTRRNQSKAQFKNLVIDYDLKAASLNGVTLDLSPTEYRLLEFLSIHQGESFNREDLLLKVWGYTAQGYEYTVNTTVNRLRLKIEQDQNNPFYIRTVRGFGYRFATSDEIQM